MAGRDDRIFLLCSQDELSEVVWISYAICHIPCGCGLFCLREQGIYILKNGEVQQRLNVHTVWQI